MIESISFYPTRPVDPLILLGVLKGYVKNPLSVLARTFSNMRRIKNVYPANCLQTLQLCRLWYLNQK